MVRNLAHEGNDEKSPLPHGKSDESRDKAFLNRRGYIKLGVLSLATILYTGTGLTETSSDDKYTTDFSEYAV